MERALPNLILIAGLPASGKSSFAEFASKQLSFPVIVKDEIKEYLFDSVGFTSSQGKTDLDIAASNIMMYTAGKILSAGKSVILDNNFEDRNMAGLKKLVAEHPCNVVTVKFTGDPEVFYRRFLERDNDPNRHPGHKLTQSYPPVPGLEETYQSMMSLEAFLEKYRKRGTFAFSFGQMFEVDVTDYSKVSYDEILAKLRSLLV